VFIEADFTDLNWIWKNYAQEYKGTVLSHNGQPPLSCTEVIEYSEMF